MPEKRSTQHARVRAEGRLRYAEMFEEQGGVCAICKNPPKAGGKPLHVDHDHHSMVIRGLLCFRCNRALPSYFGPDWLRAAAEYLERSPHHEGQQAA